MNLRTVQFALALVSTPIEEDIDHILEVTKIAVIKLRDLSALGYVQRRHRFIDSRMG